MAEGAPVSRFAALTPDTAQGSAKELLAGLVARHGRIGPMVATMAHSPAVLGGYLELSRVVKRTKLARPVSERVSLAVQEHLGCQLCLAAHTNAVRAIGISEQEIELARLGTSDDPAIAALVEFGLRVLTAPAKIDNQQVELLRGYGYSDREIADVVGVVALNVLTGTFNLVAGLEPEH
jgi:AhpD family alkylhydroperoxidase